MADTTIQPDHTTAPATSSPNGTVAGLKDSIVNSESAADTIANHPVTQSVTQGKISSTPHLEHTCIDSRPGPVAQKARDEAAKTSDQFSNVAASRKIPDEQTATGQSLTQYHSLFYNVLSWENPRVSAIIYASIVTLIFVTRYVPVLSLFFKFTYIVLGVIAAAEVSGKLIFDRGLATQMRPRKYYTIPRESLEAALEDTEQLINFFVIEFQRIVFAENIYATIAAFSSALIAYVLVKFVPKWGIALIGTTTLFFVPLIYIQNREFIDEHLNNAGNIINQQASQVKDLAAEHTGRASEVAKSTVSQYSAKAQELYGQATGKTAPTETTPTIKKEDFPTAPKDGPAIVTTTNTVEPVHAE